MANEVSKLPKELRVSQAGDLSLLLELIGCEKVGSGKPQQAAFGCRCLGCKELTRKRQPIPDWRNREFDRIGWLREDVDGTARASGPIPRGRSIGPIRICWPSSLPNSSWPIAVSAAPDASRARAPLRKTSADRLHRYHAQLVSYTSRLRPCAKTVLLWITSTDWGPASG
jgi:hypothetical protein